MKLLLHSCCAACTLACLGGIPGGGQTELFWYNPNIHPLTEYEKRLSALAEAAGAENMGLEKADRYGLKDFLRAVFADMENTPAGSRCKICYKMRMEKTAAFAAENGFDAFSTSLLASEHQNHEAIRQAAEEAAEQYRVKFFYRDFRASSRQGKNKARAAGLYMQKYCGCIFSEEERYST
ncbi:MAG: epoxyqueuosine reductase QueH [Spirochaetes bacterium]|nr:epoxyqueuosine reductase QueH [Spirochaetota bacterium]